MTITRDGDTILNIEYSDKEIRRYLNHETKRMEFDCHLNGEYVGTRDTHHDACVLLDGIVYEQLKRGA